MRAAEWKRAAIPLQSAVADFRAMTFGLVREHHWVAECIYADTSSFKRERFFIQAFALPLFVPTDHLYFNYGFRIGTQWDGVDDETVSAVVAALPRLEALTGWPALVAAARDWEINLRHAELRLCVGVLAPDDSVFAPARRAIERWQVSAGWENEIRERSRALLGVLDRDGHDAGVHELEERRAQVLALLR